MNGQEEVAHVQVEAPKPKRPYTQWQKKFGFTKEEAEQKRREKCKAWTKNDRAANPGKRHGESRARKNRMDPVTLRKTLDKDWYFEILEGIKAEIKRGAHQEAQRKSCR